MKKQLKSRPPEGSVDDFISGAEKQKEKMRKIAEEVLPWEDAGVREDVTKVYNLRLSEPYFLKLKYIAEHTPESMQTFCLRVLLPEIDGKIKDLVQR